VPLRFRKESLDSGGVQWSLEDYKLAERPANFSIPAVSQSGRVGPLQYFSFPHRFHLESTGMDRNPQEWTGILRNRQESTGIDRNLNKN
jgi:hypothetical protein